MNPQTSTIALFVTPCILLWKACTYFWIWREGLSNFEFETTFLRLKKPENSVWAFAKKIGCVEKLKIQNLLEGYLPGPENGKLFRPTDRRVLPYFQYVEHLVAEITDDLVNRRPRKKLVISNTISRVFSTGWCTTNSWFDNFFQGVWWFHHAVG